jgi:hypothetical protein
MAGGRAKGTPEVLTWPLHRFGPIAAFARNALALQCE